MYDNFAHNLPALSLSDDSAPLFPVGWIVSDPKRILHGLPFAAAVMFFFLAHEMGHYLYCRRYGIHATLPFFIPMPTLIGTMGAVILIRSPIRSRKAFRHWNCRTDCRVCGGARVARGLAGVVEADSSLVSSAECPILRLGIHSFFSGSTDSLRC